MPAAEARMSSLPGETPPDPLAASAPPTLARVLTHHALLAALGALSLALLLSLLQAQQQTGDDVSRALATARLSRYLGNLPQMSDAQALVVLRHNADLGHLRLRVTDGDGHVHIGAELPISATEPSVAWTVARPNGLPWTVSLVAAPEAGWVAQTLAALRSLAWLALPLAVVLAAMAWSLARTLAPAGGLLAALRLLQRGEPETAERLPRLQVAELEDFRAGLQQLATSIGRREQWHRTTLQQLLALQEAERGRLARSLDDEFAQPLGSLRLDAAWLRRQLAANRQFEPVVSGMLARLAGLSHGLSRMLVGLNPLAVPPGAADPAATDHPDVLRELLLSMTEDGPAATGATLCTLDFQADVASLPRALLLVVVRMSREALLNVARHAGARHASLRVAVDGRSRQLHWSVTDDGRGISDAASSGTGLEGLRAHARAFGGELSVDSGPGGRGLTVSASLKLAA